MELLPVKKINGMNKSICLACEFWDADLLVRVAKSYKNSYPCGLE